MRNTAGALFTLLAIACGGSTPGSVAPLESVLRDSTGAEVGRVSLREPGSGGSVQLEVRVSNLPAGLHGMHLHQAGRCEAPGFQTAGAHFNPTNKKHGHQNPEGAHLGDLGNLQVAVDRRGQATVPVTLPNTVTGLQALLALGQDGGLALVIHADRDDEVTDPSGNSGARIACGAIVP